MSRDDEPSFADLIGPVRRVRSDTVAPTREPRKRRDATPPIAAPRAPTPPWRDTPDDIDADTAEGADHYHRPGVQHKLLRKLRRGQLLPDDEIDLHGLTVAEARLRLADFLLRAGGRRLRCVRVIHGKGFSSPGMRPVLKPAVRAWLRQDVRVLAYATAQAHDGGGGAVYVLLRARTDER